MQRSVLIPSSNEMATKTPARTWHFLIGCVRPEGLMPPSIFSAFALLGAGLDVIEPCALAVGICKIPG
jgi:hypothetical protein